MTKLAPAFAALRPLGSGVAAKFRFARYVARLTRQLPSRRAGGRHHRRAAEGTRSAAFRPVRSSQSSRPKLRQGPRPWNAAADASLGVRTGVDLTRSRKRLLIAVSELHLSTSRVHKCGLCHSTIPVEDDKVAGNRGNRVRRDSAFTPTSVERGPDGRRRPKPSTLTYGNVGASSAPGNRSGFQGLPGGAEGIRTPDLCSAIAALSHLSYSPHARVFTCEPWPCQRGMRRRGVHASRPARSGPQQERSCARY